MTGRLPSWRAQLASGEMTKEVTLKTKDGAPKKEAERVDGKAERAEML